MRFNFSFFRPHNYKLVFLSVTPPNGNFFKVKKRGTPATEDVCRSGVINYDLRRLTKHTMPSLMRNRHSNCRLTFGYPCVATRAIGNCMPDGSDFSVHCPSLFPSAV